MSRRQQRNAQLSSATTQAASAPATSTTQAVTNSAISATQAVTAPTTTTTTTAVAPTNPSGVAPAVPAPSAATTATAPVPPAASRSAPSAVPKAAATAPPPATVPPPQPQVAAPPLPDGTYEITFTVGYNTIFGQEILLVGSCDLLGAWDVTRAMSLYFHCNTATWRLTRVMDLSAVDSFEYKYVLRNSWTGQVTWETGADRFVNVSALQQRTTLVDQWQSNDRMDQLVWGSTAFRDVVFRRDPISVSNSLVGADLVAAAPEPEPVTTVRLVMKLARVSQRYSLFLSGSLPQLGSWRPTNAVKLNECGEYWTVDIAVLRSQLGFEYKYCLIDPSASTADIVWESGANRRVRDPSPVPDLVVVEEYPFQFAHAWRGAGVVMPVFSLRTSHSVGVGDFYDLVPLIHWASAVGLCLVQTLPVNDTSITGTWTDSYPYGCCSVFALHPIYVNLFKLGDGVGGAFPCHLRSKVEEAARRLDFPQLDFESTLKFKLEILHEIFLACEPKLATGTYEPFEDFCRHQREWLPAYAAFCYLRDLFGTADHSQWGTLAHSSPALIERLTARTAPHFRAILFTYFVQFHLFSQLAEVSRIARSCRVILKGDLPIGVHPHSCETWLHPRLFRTHMQAGCPPDAFSPDGQNWAFPTYNWEAMADDGYDWWIRRLKYMANFYHAYRIDHILGFFRMWEIPAQHVSGLLGHFYPALAVERSELESCGIWDIDRLADTYITYDTLESAWGASDSAKAAESYFDHHPKLPGRLVLKPLYSTQKLIMENVGDATERTRLMRVSSELVLLRDECAPTQRFHFRFGCYDTHSFRALPADWQNTLRRLYNNYYFERQDRMWKSLALQKLPALRSASEMLICGEDLGFIPACVSDTLSELVILGLRIQRMSTDATKEFGIPSEYPANVVCSPSCHDVTNIRGWWLTEPQTCEKFFRHVLGEHTAPFPRTCEPWIVRKVVQQHLESPAILAVFPLSDLLGMNAALQHPNPLAETINDPTNPKHYWRYRLHFVLDTVLDTPNGRAFTREMRDMLLATGRSAL